MTLTPPAAPSTPGDVPVLDLTVAPPPGPSVRAKRWTAGITLGACVAGLAYVYTFNPNVAGAPYPGCLFKSATGLDCPGCGGTRAVYALMHGDVAAAADHYILVFLVLPVLAYLLAGLVLAQFDVKLPMPRAKRWMGWATLAAFAGFTVVRNLPFGPLPYLQSGLL